MGSPSRATATSAASVVIAAVMVVLSMHFLEEEDVEQLPSAPGAAVAVTEVDAFGRAHARRSSSWARRLSGVLRADVDGMARSGADR